MSPTLLFDAQSRLGTSYTTIVTSSGGLFVAACWSIELIAGIFAFVSTQNAVDVFAITCRLSCTRPCEDAMLDWSSAA